MKISKLPYYVKFVFLCSNGTCISTTDVEMIDHIIDPDTGRRIYSLDVGDRIIFEQDYENIYKIKSIGVRQIQDDTDLMKYGFDTEDCTEPQGASKDWLLKLLITADLED